MREWIVRKWNWNNGTDYANWISGEITDKVLAEFWYWYRDLKKKIRDLSKGRVSFRLTSGEVVQILAISPA